MCVGENDAEVKERLITPDTQKQPKEWQLLWEVTRQGIQIPCWGLALNRRRAVSSPLWKRAGGRWVQTQGAFAVWRWPLLFS